jgi:hypothetical protein
MAMNEDLQDEYALIVNEFGKAMDAVGDIEHQEVAALETVVKLLGNFNLRLSRIEEKLHS